MGRKGKPEIKQRTKTAVVTIAQVASTGYLTRLPFSQQSETQLGLVFEIVEIVEIGVADKADVYD